MLHTIHVIQNGRASVAPQNCFVLHMILVLYRFEIDLYTAFTKKVRFVFLC